MKSLTIQNKSTLKVLRGERELSEKDLLELPKGLTPGEWVLLADEVNSKNYIAYVNPYSQSFYKIKILEEDTNKKNNTSTKEEDVAREVIKRHLESAIRVDRKD